MGGHEVPTEVVVKLPHEHVESVFAAGVEAGTKAGALAQIAVMQLRVRDMIEKDYAGPYDDRRGLEALRTYLDDEFRRVQAP